MAASKLLDVGQMRRSRGTSMKRIIKEEILGKGMKALVEVLDGGKGGRDGEDEAYRQMALMTMIVTDMVKRLAMPRAKQSIMDRMPSLEKQCQLLFLGSPFEE